MTEPIDGFEALRARVLTHIVPALCHKLNNSMAVVSGMSEMVVHSSDPDARKESNELVIEHSKLVSKQLARLAAFASVNESELASEDAGSALLDAAALLEPVFHVLETKFEVSEPEVTYPVVIDRRRLTKVLVILTVNPLLALEDEQRETGRASKLERVELSIAEHPKGAAIRIAYQAVAEARWENAVEHLQPILHSFGASVETETKPAETVHRVLLPGVEG